MPYTFVPKEKHAKAYASSARISRKAAVKICRVISKKTLVRAKRLLMDLMEGRRSLEGKYYSKAVPEILGLLESCEKNAESLELDSGRLFVHASAHQGAIMRRRRRKSAFGSRLKSTNMEIMLVERGREQKVKVVRSKKDLEKAVKEVAEKVARKSAAAEAAKKEAVEEKAAADADEKTAA